MENWFIPYHVSELPLAQKVLILAPHPDDEVFGCGGAAALLRQRGASVDVVVLTDGAASAAAALRQAITQTRQSETNAALAVLGVPPAQFWALADRSLAAETSLAQKITALLSGVDLVFAPSPTEAHPDHAATGRAVLSAVHGLVQRSGKAPGLLFYEVGVPLLPNFMLDISAVWPAKQRAMHCFESQQLAQDYARHIEGLNAFRTYSLPASVRYAEAYYHVPVDKINSEWTMADVPGRAHGWDKQGTDRLLATAEATVETLIAQKDQLMQEVSHIKQLCAHEVAEMREKVRAQEALQQALLNSRSWRITRPLRWLAQKLPWRG